MEKKLISLLLAVLMMFSALPITVFAAESEYPESEHPYEYGDYEWTYEGKPGTKSLSVTFSDNTEFHEGDELDFYDQNGNLIGSAGNELAGKTVDFNASSLRIRLYGWNSDSSYYGFKITNIRENNYEVDGTVIPGEDCKITEDRSTGTITFEPATTESDDGYISLSYSVLGSRTVKWVKRIVVKSGFNATTYLDAFVNAEVLDFAEDFDFRGYEISETAFLKNKSNWDNESLYLGNKLVILGENDKIKDGTKFICSEAIDYYYHADAIIPDSVIYIGENNHPNSIMCTRGSYAESWANKNEWIECTCIGDLKIKFKNCIISKGTPLSSAIEVYKLSPDYTWKQISEYSSSGYSLSKVGAQTVTISDGEESLDFTIITSDGENQYINFNDKYLPERLEEVDLNDDGAITVDEMRSYDGDISLYRVRDVSGLEYADSALFIYGWEESLVSIEDYFSLQKYDDLTVTEGKAFLSFFKNYGRERLEYYDNLLNELKVTSSNSSVVSIDKKCMNFLTVGDSVITVTLGSVSKKFTIHVTSSDYNKDLGSTIKEIPNLTSAGIVNTANGDVYQKTTSGLKKVNSGKKVLMSSFYPGRDDNNSCAYYITDNGELWKSDEKIGENFLKLSDELDRFGFGLALDKEGNCYRLSDFKLMNENVKDINDNVYLTNDGKVYASYSDYDRPIEKCKNVKSIIRNNYYINNDEKTCWSRGDLVDHKVKDIAFLYSASYYYIDNDDSLWMLEYRNGSPVDDKPAVKIASDVDRINESNWNAQLLVFQTKNGDYYQLKDNYSNIAESNPEDITPTLTNIKEMGVSFYLDKENNLYATKDYEGTIYSGESIISKIMTNVTAFKESYDYGNPYNHFAVFTRTDGSVWSYTVGDEEPIKLLEGEDYTPEHTHTFNHITVPSTCKVAGMEYDICSECGETFNEKTLPLATHTWSEWTIVKEATTTAEGQEKRTCSVCDKVEIRAIEKLKVIKDDKTGIEINYNNEYDSDTEIKVEEQFSGKSFQLINTEFGKVNSKIYDIATYKDGVKVQPNGEITVKIPLPDGFTTNKVFVCYVDSVSGKVTKIPCEVKDGYVIFKTNHFSEYAIVEQSANVKSVSVSDITLNYKKSATIKPTIKADKGAKYTVKYSSSNTKVATVDENGKVYAAKKGSATITCTVTDSNGNTVQDTCKVTVKYSFGQWLIKILLFGWIWY